MDACQHCGAAFTKATAKFCGKCGARKSALATSTTVAAGPVPLTNSFSHTAPTVPTTTHLADRRREENPNHTLRPSSGLRRGSSGPPPPPAALSAATATTPDRAPHGGGGGRLSLSGHVGLERTEAGGAQRRQTLLSEMLAAAATTPMATAPPAHVPSTVEFKDPLDAYTRAHGGAELPSAPPPRRSSTSDHTRTDKTTPVTPTEGKGKPSSAADTVPPPPTPGPSKKADGDDDVEVFDVEDAEADQTGLFMPMPPTSAALLHREHNGDDGAHAAVSDERLSDAVLTPDPVQEAQYTAWSTLGPDGITPEMLQTSNIAELRGWQKGALIGRGTYGSVYLGLLRDGSFQAVKCVELGARAQAAGTFDVKELVSLSREINMMQRLHHKNLCKFRGVFYNPQETSICMFMEYIGGGSVSTLAKRFRPLPSQVVRSWTKQLLSGLLYLHSQNIIHRDIKGDNVLVDTSASPTSESQIKLVDFGAARRLTDAVAQSRTVIGTPYWMAPEVVDLSGEGAGYSYKADVWSTGCTVAEMLTGKPPWPTRTNAPAAIMMIASAEGMPTEIPKAEATPGCYDFMLACFERDPAKRPTVEDLLEHPWIKGDME